MIKLNKVIPRTDSQKKKSFEKIAGPMTKMEIHE
jgi:hypothetical protein